MTGTASSQVRSAYVAEVTPGTIPATTPGFKTLHRPAIMQAKAQTIQGQSLIAGGRRLGRAVNGIDVTGALESPLIYGVYDDLLATLLQGTWATNVMKDGKSETTVTIENTMAAGVGGASTMLRYRGVEAVSGTLSLAAREAAKLSLTFAGRASDDATVTGLVGATYTDPTEADPLSSGADVGTIVMTGFTPDCIQSLNISLAFEGRDLQPRVSSNDLCGINRGNFLPVLTARMYIGENFLAIYNAARVKGSAFSVTVPLGSVTTEKYTLVFPKCNFGATEIDQGGAALMQSIEILPQYDASSSATLIVTRAVA